MGEPEGAVAMDASGSQFLELLLCHNKKKEKKKEKLRRDLNVKRHQERGRDKNRGEKSWDVTA